MGAAASVSVQSSGAAKTVNEMNLPADTSTETKAKITGQLTQLSFFMVRAL